MANVSRSRLAAPQNRLTSNPGTDLEVEPETDSAVRPAMSNPNRIQMRDDRRNLVNAALFQFSPLV